MTLTLLGATLIDGTGAQPVPDAVVQVEGARITAISGNDGVDAAGSAIDVTGLTLLPGLIDLHTHLGIVDAGHGGAASPALTAALLFENAELCLMAGFTTVREMGGADGALRDLISTGKVKGPRLFPSGPILCQTGGHGDIRRPFDQGVHHEGISGLAQPSLVCDTPDGVTRAAREAFRRGATQLKMCISGGVISLSDSVEDTQFSLAELQAAVAEARARDTYVTGHAMNSAAVNLGLDAGLECFEHAPLLDEQTARRLASTGAALVPTLAISHLFAQEWRNWGMPEEIVPRMKGMAAQNERALKLAHESGVRVGSGSDLLGPQQNRRGLEITLKAAVIGPMAALTSTTETNAHILRREHDLGTVAVGRCADIIAVSGDPLAEPELFDDPDRVVLVIKDGQVVKDSR